LPETTGGKPVSKEIRNVLASLLETNSDERTTMCEILNSPYLE
jgi:hypothetical protein